MSWRGFLALWASCCLWLGCGVDGPTALPPVDYVRWVKDPAHGLVQSKQIEQYAFIAQYKPLDFVVAQEERQPTLDKARVEARRAELGEDHVYYNFRIKNTEGQLSPLGSGVQTDQVYQSRLGYFTFDMQADLYLLHGQDTLPCTLFQFVRSYDVAPYVEFALGFKKPMAAPLTEDLTLVFEDRVLGVGPMRLRFEQAIFEKLPKLKTS